MFWQQILDIEIPVVNVLQQTASISQDLCDESYILLGYIHCIHKSQMSHSLESPLPDLQMILHTKDKIRINSYLCMADISDMVNRSVVLLVKEED